jgi:AraC-like DNA-binding protein
MIPSSYRPKQPYFEDSGEAYVSCEETETLQGIQFYSFLVSGDPQKRMVVVPDGTIDIVFHCSSHRPEAFVCGSVKKGTPSPFVLGDRYFGARFYPSAAQSLVNCPLDEFTEREVPLLDVEPKARESLEKICGSTDFSSQMELFQRFRRQSRKDDLKSPPMVPYLLNEIHRGRGELRVHELEEKSGYSGRHIDNLFKKHVGMGPKFYCRIVRFQKTLHRMEGGRADDFAQIAEEAGYYDQAHFINEFRTFCSKTPRQFFLAG